MLAQPLSPIIIRSVGQPTPEVSLLDVLVQAMGLVGVLVLTAVVLGLALGGIFILVKKRREATGEDEGNYGFKLTPD
jgi:multisubunit Na+/H+ antiporter MnhC subunit